MICLYTVKWFPSIALLQCNISFLNEFKLICLDSSIPIVSIQLNGLNNCYPTQTILFNISHLLTHSEVVTNIAI